MADIKAAQERAAELRRVLEKYNISYYVRIRQAHAGA